MKRLPLTVLAVATFGLTVATAADAIQPFATLTQGTQFPVETTLAVAGTTGQFVTVEQDHPTTGTASIVTENGQTFLVFDDAFDTARGPDVQIVFYVGSDVPVNLEEGDYVTIAPLQSFEGSQRYLIPAGVNVDEYGAVGIWCREFNVTFGYATL